MTAVLTDTVREGAIAIAQRAARAILEVYQADFDVVRKGDDSPLTAADLASHRCIVEGLSALAPDIPVLSEESESLPAATRRAWHTFWLVDPLDGTREFVKRNGEFSVNIALVVDGTAEFGVVQAPVTGALWHGGRTLGAFARGDDGTDTPVTVRAPAHPPLRIAASRSHRDGRTEAFIDALSATHATELMSLGSSLKFCALAEGRLDLYPRFGPTCEWDTAAGQCVLEGAGGQVLDRKGRPLRYNQRDTLLNGDFIALGDARLPWRHWQPETAA